LGALLLSLVACASSSPEPTAQFAAVAPADSGVPAVIGQAEAADGGLHVVDVPEAPKAANPAAAAGTPPEDELVCKRIKTTGSHRMTRVCWTRADIEARRASDKQSMDAMRRRPSSNTAGGEPAVGP
jgi:hypothetical protein